jgi:cell wall-associated NlpC family hydrolase
VLREKLIETLLPGDLAITADGVHVMVYSGPGKWIQADPGENKVVTLDPGTSENGWFDSKIAMFRWSQLSN